MIRIYDKPESNNNVIYKITSTITGCFYIGSAKLFNLRYNRHNHDLLKNKHGNPKLQNHVNKYGITDLSVSFLEYNCIDLVEREQFFIDTLKPGFNINLIAQSPKGVKRTPEQIQRMIDGKKIKSGWKLSAEACRKIGDAHRGRKHSEETKMKISKGNTGKVRSVEFKEKISWAAGGKRHSEETKKNISIRMKGNQHGRKKTI